MSYQTCLKPFAFTICILQLKSLQSQPNERNSVITNKGIETPKLWQAYQVELQKIILSQTELKKKNQISNNISIIVLKLEQNKRKALNMLYFKPKIWR